ncbi:peptidoglycan-binding protein [Pendulispora brunnea]|uniref:Peptidoglycan-binding protein n=1 Tax=Pendulispora brunnea TaxID=2905690 RepID=A0ABZ2KKG9_9BACT
MQYTVVQGDCLSTIARRFGFSDWRKIYDAPQNADFRQKRPNPNVIQPGDVLFVPEKTPKTVKVATGKTHRFVVRLPVVRLRLRLHGTDGKPLAGIAYTLRAGSVERKGKTKPDGLVDEEIPADATAAELAFDDYGVTKAIELGALDPIESPTGVQARLLNLGYDCGAVDGVLGPKTRAALRAFQTDNPPLEVSGACDEKTRGVLRDQYGC